MKESRANSLAAERRPAGTTPLERSWAAAAVLLVWLGAFVAFSLAGAGAGGSAAGASSDAAVSSWSDVGPTVIYAATALLIGLVVFSPARTSAAASRVSVYALPVLLLTVLFLLMEPGVHVGLAIAFLPPWALFTALYGLRGGLPTGGRYLIMYAAAALVAVGAGYLAVRIVLSLAFAGLPVGVPGWLLPLLPLLLLLQTRYRANRRRAIVEIVLSALAAACGTAWFGLLGYGPGWSPDLGVLFALPVWIVAVLPTAVLLTLGHLERFDTAEYQ